MALKDEIDWSKAKISVSPPKQPKPAPVVKAVNPDREFSRGWNYCLYVVVVVLLVRWLLF